MDNGFCNVSIKRTKFKKGNRKSLTNLGVHLLRTHKVEYNLADTKRRNDNEVLISMEDKTLAKSLNMFLKKNNLQTRNSTTVEAYQVVFSIPKEIFGNKKLIKEFKKRTLDFINTNEIFKDNCLMCVYHGDETQPHIQAIFVPRVGTKLDFKSLLGGPGGPQKLHKLHDDYASVLEPLGFKRGDGSHTNDLTEQQYKKSISEISKPIPEPKILNEVPEVGLFNKNTVIDKLQKNCDILEKENKSLKKTNRKINFFKTQNEVLKSTNTKLKNHKRKLESENMKITKEQTELLRQVPCNEVLELLGYEVKEEGITYRMKNDEFNIVINESNKFTDNKSMVQGFGSISMLVDIFNYKFTEAITFLTSNFGFERTAKVISANKKQSEAIIKQAVKSSMLEMPKPAPNNISKITDYLCKTRKISKTLVEELIKKNMLFADNKSNCIFTNDKNTFAFIRGTYEGKRFVGVKGDIDFIQYDYGNPETKYLFESAIDALSFRSMNPEANGTYIVLNGSALVNRIHEVTDQADKVYLCFDNDEQGAKFCDKISQQLLCEVEIIKPVSKDFNEDLINGNYTSPKGSLDLSSRNPKIG